VQAFIVTVSPSVESISETISTLQFADRAKKVVVETSANRHSILSASQSRGLDGKRSEEYEEEISDLKLQLKQALAENASLQRTEDRRGSDEQVVSGPNASNEASPSPNAVTEHLCSIPELVSVQVRREQAEEGLDMLLLSWLICVVKQEHYIKRLQESYNQNSGGAIDAETLKEMGPDGTHIILGSRPQPIVIN